MVVVFIELQEVRKLSSRIMTSEAVTSSSKPLASAKDTSTIRYIIQVIGTDLPESKSGTWRAVWRQNRSRLVAAFAVTSSRHW